MSGVSEYLFKNSLKAAEGISERGNVVGTSISITAYKNLAKMFGEEIDKKKLDELWIQVYQNAINNEYKQAKGRLGSSYFLEKHEFIASSLRKEAEAKGYEIEWPDFKTLKEDASHIKKYYEEHKKEIDDELYTKRDLNPLHLLTKKKDIESPTSDKHLNALKNILEESDSKHEKKYK